MGLSLRANKLRRRSNQGGQQRFLDMIAIFQPTNKTQKTRENEFCDQKWVEKIKPSTEV